MNLGRVPPDRDRGRPADSPILGEGGVYMYSRNSGALTFSPPMFSPSDNSTHTVGPSDSWTAVCLVLVTNG
jgi:hypothetical protein